MSDNGIKAEEDRLQDREEGGDDEVRPLSMSLRSSVPGGHGLFEALLKRRN